MTTERIKALEVQQLNDTEARAVLLSKVDNIERDVQEIKLSLGRQKGYIAGAMSVVVVIWTVILSAAAVMWDKIVDQVTGILP